MSRDFSARWRFIIFIPAMDGYGISGAEGASMDEIGFVAAFLKLTRNADESALILWRRGEIEKFSLRSWHCSECSCTIG
jgi:hypothetical protein